MGHSNWKRRPCYVCCGALIVLALWLVPEWYQATGSQHKQWQQSSRTGESRDSTRARHSQMAEVALEDLQGLRPRTEGAYKGRHAKHVKIIQTRKRVSFQWSSCRHERLNRLLLSWIQSAPPAVHMLLYCMQLASSGWSCVL